MKLTYDHYYFVNHSDMDCPQWVRAERYNFCEHFYKFFSLFSRK